MIDLFAIIIFIIGLLGISCILLKKIPVLVELPKTSQEFTKESLFSKLKNLLGRISFLKSFSFEILLQKILSKVRILTLRIENKISFWLEKLRQRTLKKKNNFSDNYWQELKSFKTKKRGRPRKNKTL